MAPTDLVVDVSFDTRDDVCDAATVLKTKRTYNLSRRTIETVQALAERGIAPTQDALVELAVEELARCVRDADEAAAWASATTDPPVHGGGRPARGDLSRRRRGDVAQAVGLPLRWAVVIVNLDPTRATNRQATDGRSSSATRPSIAPGS